MFTSNPNMLFNIGDTSPNPLRNQYVWGFNTGMHPHAVGLQLLWGGLLSDQLRSLLGQPAQVVWVIKLKSQEILDLFRQITPLICSPC